MKLYTEDQMKQCFNDAQMQWANYRFMYQDFDEYKIACSLTPIKLPNKEEIIEESFSCAWGSLPFELGAEWVLEQIKQQSNG